jgi:hypothetical protein
VESADIRWIKKGRDLEKNPNGDSTKVQIKSAVGYQSNSAFVWALSASLSPRSPPANSVLHQNCMKIKRPPSRLQLAITLVVHCGTELGHGYAG